MDRLLGGWTRPPNRKAERSPAGYDDLFYLKHRENYNRNPILMSIQTFSYKDPCNGEKHIDKKLFLFRIIIHAKRKWKKTDSEEYLPILPSLLLLLLLREGGSLRLLPFPDPPVKNPKGPLIYKN